MSGRGSRNLFLSWLLALAPLLASAADLPRRLDRWIRVDTEHFTLIGNASRGDTLRLGRSLEGLRAVLERLAPEMRMQSPVPTYVYVFSDDRSFRPYKPLVGGRPTPMDGVFLGHRDGNYVAINVAAKRDPANIVYHEYLHYFISNNLPEAPLWYSEGIAEYFSTFRIYGTRAQIGRPISRHVHWVRGNSLIPLERLFAIGHDDAEYAERHRRGVFYAQSWLLVHYLQTVEEDGADKLERLLLALRDGEAAPDAFLRVFGYDLREMLGRLRRYARNKTFHYAEHTDPSLETATRHRIERMRPAETLARLGNLLAHNEPVRADAAERHFRAALEHDGDHALAWTGLGYVHDLRGEREAAEACYGRAQRHAPARYLAWQLHADSLMDRFYGSDGVRERADENDLALLRRARSLYERAAELNPELGEVQAGLGKTFVFEPSDVRPGIAALERALELLGERPDILYDLVLLHVAAGNRDAAFEQFRTLERGGDARLVASARDNLVQLDLLRINELLDAGRIPEALELVGTVRASIHDPLLRERLAPQLERIERLGETNRWIERYNEAVRLARDNRKIPALELLDELLRHAQDPDLLEAARTLQRQLRR